jgi:flagellar hook-basal body complex protein FliE
MNSVSSFGVTTHPGFRAAQMARLRDAAGAFPAAELAKVAGPGGPEMVAPSKAAGTSFESTLGKMVAEVNSKQVAAGEAVSGMVSGQNVSLHQAMIAMEEASVSFQLMVEVRNKLLESYQELMRMQV